MYEVITLVDGQRWEKTVDAVPGADVFYRAGFCKALENEGQGEARLFVCHGEGTTAIYPFFVREIPGAAGNSTLYDISSPYGFSGPLFTSAPRREDIRGYIRDLHLYCRENRIVSEFIRFHPIAANHRHFLLDFSIAEAGRVVCVPLQRSQEEIWQGYARNNRKNINKAERSSLEFIIDREGKYFPEFYRIYLSTMERNNAKEFYYFSKGFFDLLHRELAGRFFYVHVLRDQEVISTELVLHSNDTIHSFLGGTNEECFPLRPNNLLKHRLILWARERGYKNFLLGGGYTPGDGIFQFKASFYPQGIIPFYIGRQVHLPKEYAGLCGGKEFFPPYRKP